MLFSPERLAISGIAAYLLIFLITPIDTVFPTSWESIGFIALCYGFFFLGCSLARRELGPTKHLSDSFSHHQFWVCAIVGGFGMALRLYDKWISRGAGLTESILESREALGDSAAGPLAAVGGLLYPFCYIPLMLWWARSRESNSRSLWQSTVAIALFWLPAVDALLLLSRSQLLVTLSVMYFSVACIKYNGNILHKKLSLPVIAGFSSVLLISILAFSSRLAEMDLDLIFSILNSAYGYVVSPNQWALSILEQRADLISSSLGGLLPIAQYYVHGLFEFGLLWTREDPQTFTLGTQHFAPIVKALTIAGIPITMADESTYARIGVFTTFFGPLWTDFGWASLSVMFLFGLFARFLSNKVVEGQLQAVPLYVYLSVVIFFMPVVNFVVSAQGMYAIIAFVIFWSITSLVSHRK